MPTPAHPAELARLDLFEVWTSAPDLAGRFDPFLFEHRMVAYRAMIDRLNGDGRFGTDNRRNPLWGLMFQHQWQYRTGRLGARTRVDGRIDPDAPWGYGNYALCVVPWLGAVAAGVVDATEIAGPPGPSRFRYAAGGGPAGGDAAGPLELPGEWVAGVADWGAFFALAVAPSPTADDEPLRLALWKAHKTCLDVVAARLATIDPAPWPAEEMRFLRGWCRMVDYLWAAAWPTDFDFMVSHGSDVLPERLLAAGDGRPGASELPPRTDLPPKVRRNVRNVMRLADTPGWRYTLDLRLWKRVMRSRDARDRVVPLLDAVFNPRPDNAAERRRLLRYLLRP